MIVDDDARDAREYYCVETHCLQMHITNALALQPSYVHCTRAHLYEHILFIGSIMFMLMQVLALQSLSPLMVCLLLAK